MAYAKNLTKADLIAEGITEITKEGRIFKGDKEIFPHWIPNKSTGDYLGISILERDSEGHLIKGKDRVYKYTCKDGTVSEYTGWTGKLRTIGLHRAMWAWFYNEVPEGMVVDHINNKHSQIEDYYLDNLQLLTPKQNLAKERICNVKEIPCKLDRPRSYYEDKLAKYEALYEEAKKNHDKEAAHKQRANIAQTRARLRYWDSHKNEIENNINERSVNMSEINMTKEAKKQSIKDRQILEQYKLMFKEAGNKGMWHQMCKVIKAWDSLEEVQKNHVWEVLHRFFGR